MQSLSEQQVTMAEQLKQWEAKVAQHSTKDDSKRQVQLELILHEKKAGTFIALNWYCSIVLYPKSR